MGIYSHSRLSTFEQCPQRYKFKYIDRIAKAEQTIELYLGSRVHEVLEKLYADLRTGKLNTLKELFEHYRGRWKAEWSAKVRVVKQGRNARQYFQLGARCIGNYYEQYRPFGQSETVETEAQVRFALGGDEKYQFQGYIDRVARRNDGTYEIHDYKTAGSLPTQKQADADRQLALYQIGLAGTLRQRSRIELVWHYLRHRKSIHSKRTPHELVKLTESTVALIQRIENQKRFPTRVSPLCDWCEYRAECPEWGGASQAWRPEPERKRKR